MIGVYDDARDVLETLERLEVRDWAGRFRAAFLPMQGNDRLAVLRDLALELQSAIRSGRVGGSLELHRRVWTLVNSLERLDLRSYGAMNELVSALEASGEAFTLIAPGGDEPALELLGRLPFGFWGRVDWNQVEPELHVPGIEPDDVGWALEHWRSRRGLEDPVVFVMRFDADAPHLELRLSSLIRHAPVAFSRFDDVWVVDAHNGWVLEADHDGNQRFVMVTIGWGRDRPR